MSESSRHTERTPRDPLTNVYSRAALNERLQEEIARAHYEQALEICRGIGDGQGEGGTPGNLGDDAGAISYFEQFLQISHEMGNPQGESAALGDPGTACAEQGDYARARTYFEQALGISREIVRECAGVG